MKNFFVFFAVFTAMFFMIGCNEGTTVVSGTNAGKIGGECYPNKTCNEGLICDEERNICIVKPENTIDDVDDSVSQNDDETTTEDTDYIDTNSTNEDSNEQTDTDNPNKNQGELDGECYPNKTCNEGLVCDVENNFCIKETESSENNDNDSEKTPDNNDSDPDEDTDTDSGDSASDNDTDITPTTPCDPNPCSSVVNSTGECSLFGAIYKCECKSNYYWNGSVCGTVQTQIISCTGLPDNAEWNTVSEIIQTWNDDLGTWIPISTGSYNEIANTNQCRFKCMEHYSWKDSECVADTTTTDCADIPANASWNGNGKFEQTWNGSIWYPETYEPTYSKTAGTCTFTCNTDYIWSGSACIQFSNYDSDGDGDDDIAEIAYGSDPLDPASHIPQGIYYVVLPYNAPTDVTRKLTFSTKIEAIDIAIFFDDSGSMGDEIEKLKEEVKDKVVGAIANQFADNPNYASFGLVRFGWEKPYIVEQTMTTDADAVKNAIGNLKGDQGNELAIYSMYLAATGEAYTGSLLPCAMNKCQDPLLGVMHSAKYNVAKADCSGADKLGTIGGLCMRQKSMPIFVVITDEDSDECISYNSPINTDTSCMFDVGTKELSKNMTLAAMNGIGAKFIGIDSGFDDNGQKTDSAKDFFTAFAEATGSINTEGNPFIYHTENKDGTGIGDNITEAVIQLITWIDMDVTTGAISEEECNGINAANFIKSSTTIAADPETGVSGQNEKIFFSVKQGTDVTFDIHFYNDFCINTNDSFLKFEAQVNVLGNGSYLSSRLINIIVP